MQLDVDVTPSHLVLTFDADPATLDTTVARVLHHVPLVEAQLHDRDPPLALNHLGLELSLADTLVTLSVPWR